MAHITLHGRSLAPNAHRQLQPAAGSRRCMTAVQCSMPLQTNTAGSQASASRRTVLGATCAVLSLMNFQRPGLADIEVPKAYQEFAFKLIRALEEAIKIDLDGAEEREVRRKADPAKNLVREFVQRWKDAPVVRELESYGLISDTIQQLGGFYQANGARARLAEPLGGQLLEQLRRAEEALPPLPEQKLFPFPF